MEKCNYSNITPAQAGKPDESWTDLNNQKSDERGLTAGAFISTNQKIGHNEVIFLHCIL